MGVCHHAQPGFHVTNILPAFWLNTCLWVSEYLPGFFFFPDSLSFHIIFNHMAEVYFYLCLKYTYPWALNDSHFLPLNIQVKDAHWATGALHFSNQPRGRFPSLLPLAGLKWASKQTVMCTFLSVEPEDNQSTSADNNTPHIPQLQPHLLHGAQRHGRKETEFAEEVPLQFNWTPLSKWLHPHWPCVFSTPRDQDVTPGAFILKHLNYGINLII